ncbi:hypothetical protein ABTL92_19860, partial [Acinetobacter baumannii]
LTGVAPANLQALLNAVADHLNGYGNATIFDARYRIPLASRIDLLPRAGFQFTQTRLNVSAGGESVNRSEQHAGLEAGVGLAYRWSRAL